MSFIYRIKKSSLKTSFGKSFGKSVGAFSAAALNRISRHRMVIVMGGSMIAASAHAAEDYQSADYASWKSSDQQAYVFTAMGAAFLDHKQSGRKTSSGSLNLTSDDDDQISPIITIGTGWHVHKYFAFEAYYSFMTGAEYQGSINANNAVFEGYTLNGTPSYTENISGHMMGLTLTSTSYDRGDVLGFSLRGGVFVYNLTDELKLSGSGTLNGSAIAGGNNKIKLTDNGIGWTAGASFFMVPSLNSRLELRFDHMHDMDVKSFNLISASTAKINYRMTF